VTFTSELQETEEQGRELRIVHILFSGCKEKYFNIKLLQFVG
jgi:hypothetical protein